jgi:hypothetical protein
MRTNKINKIIGSLSIAGVLVILLFSFVSALGISSVISDDQDLEASSGQEVIVEIKLSNQDAEDGATFKGEIIKGSEIVSIGKEKYYVPYEEVVIAEMKVKIPESAEIGQTYDVIYKFSQVPNADDMQGITFSQSFQSGFKINVVPEKPIEPVVVSTPEGLSKTTIILLILSIIVIIVIIFFLIKRRK